MNRRVNPAWLRRRTRGAADQQIIEDLACALSTGDVTGIRSLLHPDAVLVVDGGVHPHTAGSVAGADFVTAGLSAFVTAGTSLTMASINSTPGLAMLRGDAVVGVVTAEMRAGLLSTIWVVCNPDKLRHWNRGIA